MELSRKYSFSDFVLANYEILLTIAQKNYKFVEFSTNINSREIILRHDVEFSIPIAQRMAEIEHNLGIAATYFVQVHSEFYNPIDKDSFLAIKKIVQLGHKIELHFDSHFWHVESAAKLEKCLSIDKEMLEKYFDIKIKWFSFHNTNKFILTFEKESYAGLMNVYSKFFKEEVGYCTDSTGFWRYERLEERLREAKDDNLQILIHDGMWQEEVLPPRRRIFKVIDDRADYLKSHYDKILKEFGAKNIDWDSIIT